MAKGDWPKIPYADWQASAATLHMWTQIVGKYRTAHTPWLNHSWHVTLYVTPRGLTTSPIPDGDKLIEVEFDFLGHELTAREAGGEAARLALEPMTVADFYRKFQDLIRQLGGRPDIHGAPNEVPDPVTFAENTEDKSYDADAVARFSRALGKIDEVLKHFRTGFLGKSSPVHFFWGSFDMAVTRFSGRTAPPHPGGFPALPDEITREAYSHEVSSAGFWPGGGPSDDAAFYSYAYPVPDGFSAWTEGLPEGAFYHEEAGEFVLPYEKVRAADDPEATLLQFLQATYEAAATCGMWDRAALECPLGEPGVPRPVRFAE